MSLFLSLLLTANIVAGSLDVSSSIGKLQVKNTKEVKQVLHVDSSCLDRDYADFDSYKSYLDSLGCRRMRIIAGWAKCEQVKGSYNFGWLDNVVDYCLDKGIEPWFLLAYGNPIYEGGGTKFLGGGMPVSEEAKRAWDNWVTALSEHFKGRVRSWEIWNEPEHFICVKPKDLVNRHPGHLEIYTALCERTARILRNADAGCEIAFGALAYVEPLLLKDILDVFKANKTLNLFDYLTVHGYPQRPEDNHPKEMAVEELVRKYSSHIKVWSGESGAPSSGKTGGSLSRRDWNEATQGKWDLRRMIGDHAHGYRTGVFTIADINYAKTDQIKKKNLKGLLETDENKQVVKAKEAYFAVRNLMCVIDLLDKPLKSTGITVNGVDTSISKYVFRDKESGRKSILVWEDAILPQKASIYHNAIVSTGGIRYKDPVVVDIRTGLVYALEQKNGTIQVPVYDSPVLITERGLVSIIPSGSPTSETAGILTQSLPSEYWLKSEWISAENATVAKGKVSFKSKTCRAADGSSWFVADIMNKKTVVSAKWMTAGLGVYELYLNGKIVGQEVLKPGYTHYEKTKISYTYDITAAFNKQSGAVNCLSAQMTPGWWGDKIITPNGHEGMVGRKCAFRSVLELTYEDGSRQLFPTDTQNWKAGEAGPVRHAGIYDGEVFDARRKPGFAIKDSLGAAEINREFNGIIIPTDGAEIYRREDLTLPVRNAYVWKGVTGEKDGFKGKVVVLRNYKTSDSIVLNPGETLVVDFGQNCAGVPEFVFKAKEGTHLQCLPSEILNDGNGSKERGMDGPEGSCHRLNLRIPEYGMSIDYTFGPEKGWASYSPRCSFFGFRYISVTADAPVCFKKIVSIPVSSISETMETGRIVTGNEHINKLISNTLWGERSNYLSVPTDCPQRNERLGWTADTQVFAETGSFFADTRLFLHKWMRDMRDSQYASGSFPGVAPAGIFGDAGMRLGWADAGVIVPWIVWKQFGDTSIIDENWDAMVRYINHVVETRYEHNSIKAECRNSQWADWLSYEPLETNSGKAFYKDPNGVRNPYPETVEYWNYLGASYWLIDAQMMADMARASGRDASIFEKMVTEVRQFIRDSYCTPDGLFKTDILNTMQTPALFALKNGIFDGKARVRVIERLRENFAKHGNCLQTGFLGTSILMPTLSENGMTDIAYELLFQHSNPSWLYSIDNGATTIWERWNSYTIEKGMGPKGMNSFNHYAYGCVCEWIWKTVAGIAADINAPGFKHIIMKPVPDRRLGFVKASYRSAAGMIKSEWRYEGEAWIWHFSIPAGSSATVILPDGNSVKEYGPGDYSINLKI